jgi:hypothetical protein
VPPSFWKKQVIPLLYLTDKLKGAV